VAVVRDPVHQPIRHSFTPLLRAQQA
jgi:hypothetical protein